MTATLTPSIYPGADTKSQWFGSKFVGSLMKPNLVVVHTTEGGSWPGYQGGAEAPNLTIMANKKNEKLIIRQHFPLNRSSRALVNASGGVETNTLNAIQIELIGSCDKKDAYGAIYWPDPPDWAKAALAEVFAQLHELYPAIPLKDAAPRGWLPYPSSYGDKNGQRMTAKEWLNAYGFCGHQHVPENVHGDPGNFPIADILKLAAGNDPAPAPPKPTPTKPKTPHITDALTAKHRADRVAALKLVEERGEPGAQTAATAWLAAIGDLEKAEAEGSAAAAALRKYEVK